MCLSYQYRHCSELLVYSQDNTSEFFSAGKACNLAFENPAEYQELLNHTIVGAKDEPPTALILCFYS